MYWCTGVLVYWCTGVLVYRCTGVLVYWCTGVLDLDSDLDSDESMELVACIVLQFMRCIGTVEPIEFKKSTISVESIESIEYMKFI